jgi:hypothetical protein
VSTFRPRFLAFGLLAASGCATAPPTADRLVAPIEFRTVPGAPAFRDGRPAFRDAFCVTLRTDGLAASDDVECDRWLWRLSDEPPGDGHRSKRPANPQRLEVILVTGAFSECMGGQSRPLAAGADRLQAQGARVRTVVVGGRSGSDHNARQIADSLTASPVDAGRTVILVGYSKGGLDILHFIVEYPELAADVDAVVGIATPVFGSPLANLAAPAYRALLASLPNDKCPPGDGGVLSDLRPEVAAQWMAENPLPAAVRFYSLAAFAAQDRVARALEPTWKHLGMTEVRNDGQVVAADAIIPGSTLLGLANADHWGIALTTEMVHPVLLARTDRHPFPLEQLLVAIVAFVVDDLEQNAVGPFLESTRKSIGGDQ